MSDSGITRNALASSMKKLMRSRAFTKISVSDICEDCGMNRKSFYYHFKDKYDLVNWIFYTGFVSCQDLSKLRSEWELLDKLCFYFYEEREFYRNALEIEGQNSFREYFLEFFEPLVQHFLKEDYEGNAKSSFYIAFFCEGFLAAIMRWLTEDLQIPPEEFLNHLHLIMSLLAKRVLEDDEAAKGFKSDPRSAW